MEKLNKLYTYLGIVTMLAVCGTSFVYLSQSGVTPVQTFGSIETGQEYEPYITPWDGDNVDASLKGGWGSLGSVTITGAGDTEYWLLDATTSLALSDFSTSSALIVAIPASAAAGTYQFDIQYTTGLYLDVLSGVTGTSTISFR